MSVKSNVLKLVRRVDDAFIRTTLPYIEAGDGLVVLLFHTLHHHADELDRGLVDTRYAITVDKFRETLAHFLDAGYTPVSPEHLLAPDGGKRLLVTFDDGYFNNFLALPVLDALQVPATFFIATRYVQEGRGFWWDTLIRERTAAGRALDLIRVELGRLADHPHHAVDGYIDRHFGPAATQPVGDVDRPMTPDELRRFAAHPLVTLGNHTHHHASLTAYTNDQIAQELTLAQTALHTLAGTAPPWLSYPNGKQDERVWRQARTAGVRLGFTSRPRKTRGAPEDPLGVGRFVVSEADAVPTTCRRIRADLSLLRAYAKLRQGRLRG